MNRLKILLLALLTLGGATSAIAQTDVTVSATVPTQASAGHSSLVSDVQTLPADGSSKVTLTATIVDDSNTPVIGAAVVVTSDRGSVDTVLCYDTSSTLTGSNSSTTDNDGIVRCIAISEAPGQATFSARVDDQVTLDDKPVVTFTALPVLQNLTVTVTLPGGKKLTILQPPAKTPSTPPAPSPAPGTPLSHQSGTGQLVNTGINVEIPFWNLVFYLLLVTLVPILFVIILLLIRRIRLLLATEKLNREKEEELLKKIYLLEQQTAQTTQAIEQQTETISQEAPNPPNPSQPE